MASSDLPHHADMWTGTDTKLPIIACESVWRSAFNVCYSHFGAMLSSITCFIALTRAQANTYHLSICPLFAWMLVGISVLSPKHKGFIVNVQVWFKVRPDVHLDRFTLLFTFRIETYLNLFVPSVACRDKRSCLRCCKKKSCICFSVPTHLCLTGLW